MGCLICVKWGDKYGREYVEALREKAGEHEFVCLTDKPEESYDVALPTTWDELYNGNFWAYRKVYMFSQSYVFTFTEQTEYLYMDLDLTIQHDDTVDWLFGLDMTHPWLVHGYWNNPDTVRKNFHTYQTPLSNSSVIRWNKSQLDMVHWHIKTNIEKIFFTYKTLDNYLAHHWYRWWEVDDEGVPRRSYYDMFKGLPKNTTYSWMKGNIYPDDMEPEKHRPECKIRLYNGVDPVA